MGLLMVQSHKIASEFHRCSRFCSGQSTQKPQGSTGIGRRDLNISIKSTYFQHNSTGFHKRSNLFWEQRAGGSNLSAPTSKNNRQVARPSILIPSIVSQDGRLCPIHRGPIAMNGPRSLAVHSDSISTAPRTPVA